MIVHSLVKTRGSSYVNYPSAQEHEGHEPEPLLMFVLKIVYFN